MQDRIQQRKLFGVALLSICCISALSAFRSLRSYSQSKTQEQIDTSRFPIAESNAPLPTDPIQKAKRDRKNRKYNGRHAPVISESTDQIYSYTDWEVGLPALPIAKSSVILIGEVAKAEAYLSQDRTAVYSEFTIRIDETLKTDKSFSAVLGDSFVVERLGGRVRLPSGKLAVSVIDQQDMPRIGGRYVLFLTHSFPLGGETDDLYILTGYELRNGFVFPLDKISPKHPIAAYRGTDEMSFLTDLRNAIIKSL